MSLIGQVGKQRARARVALGFVYFLLTLGAVTTLTPFLMMALNGTKGPTDQDDGRFIPTYYFQDGLDTPNFEKPGASLFEKYVFGKYNGDLGLIRSSYSATSSSKDIDKYESLVLELPTQLWIAGFRQGPRDVTSRLSQRYQAWLSTKYSTIAALNEAYFEENLSYASILPPTENWDHPDFNPPSNRKFSDWMEFKQTLPIEFRIPVRTARVWQEFLRKKYAGNFSQVPAEIRTNRLHFEELNSPERGAPWDEFIEHLPQRLFEDSAEKRWQFLSEHEMPIRAFDQQFVREHSSEIRREFATRNYLYAFRLFALNGRALLNTTIFCFLAILTQLTVNPLAAYALSRYPSRRTGTILTFLLATMAFPAEVAMIPSFLLLKQWHLLDTFAALVLPVAANGYMIFLLKGFFDSLPTSLFEAADLDGARPIQQFAKIAAPLSKPVLGYLALLAFMSSYSAFMFAFLIVQKRTMWTLMVAIYELQIYAPIAVVMAALTLAAIPTITVFLAAQRVIMRGIVLPGER